MKTSKRLICLIIGLCSARVSANISERPYYGFEGTVTSELLRQVLYHQFRETSKEVSEAKPPESKLYLFSRRFPEQYAAFDTFVRSVFGEVNRPPRVAHKTINPAYHREFEDGFWLRYQFEYQAFELQAERLKLLNFIRRTDQIDREFYFPARRLGHVPERGWGMGHVRESLDVGYESVEQVRNRFISELNDAYVWPLLGPDVEASIHWDSAAQGMVEFEEFLAQFDSFQMRLRETNEHVERKPIVLEMGLMILKLPLFRRLKTGQGTLLGLACVYLESLNRLDPAVASGLGDALLPIFIGDVFKLAYSAISDDSIAVMVAYRGSLDLDHPSRDALEFRRIPAQENADEAAMWMRLLEGRWRRTIAEQGLVKLVRPKPPSTDREALKIFTDYIHSSEMNTHDFAKFLEPELAAQLPPDDLYPRWQVLREHILCASALDTAPST